MSNTQINYRDYNFFSNSLGARSSSRQKLVVIGGVAVLFVLMVFGVYMFLNTIAGGIQDEIAGHENYLTSPDTQNQLQNVQAQRQANESMRRYHEAMEGILHQMDSLAVIDSSYLNTITATLPENLYFQSLSMTHDQLQIQGYADTRMQIAEFLHNMTDLGIFEEVHISNIGTMDQESMTGFTFVMSCRLMDKDVMSE